MERKRGGYSLALSIGRARIVGMLQSETISSQVWGGLYPPMKQKGLLRAWFILCFKWCFRKAYLGGP